MTQPYDVNGRPLVPQAERPFVADTEIETAQETVWFNPTDKDCVLDLYKGVKPRYTQATREGLKRLSPNQLREFKNGTERWIVRAGQERAIPAEYDYGIQATYCIEPDCTAFNRMYCRDSSHHCRIDGGLGPQLINRRRQYRPILAPILQISHVTAQQAAEELVKAHQLKEASDAATILAQLKYEQSKKAAEQATAHETAQPTPAPQPAAQQHPSKKESK